MRPELCHSTDSHEYHAAGCRPARPLCRVMRRKRANRRPCFCVAYHFPHRNGSGACKEGMPAVLRGRKR